MANIDIDHYWQDIWQVISEGRAALFLGNGASCAAGIPSTPTLINMIKDRFPRMDQHLSDFMDVCQDVIDAPPYDRTQLDDFLKQKLTAVQPCPGHRTLADCVWAAMFTTNFDDLVEVAYRTHGNPIRELKPVYDHGQSFYVGNTRHQYLFKLMGSVQATEVETQMVLTRSDYRSALRRRHEHLKILMDFVKRGSLLFVGYSFKDRIVFDLMDDLIVQNGIDHMPWSYAFYRNLDDLDEKTEHNFQRRKIIPLQCDFEALMERIAHQTRRVTAPPPEPVPRVKLDQTYVNLSMSVLRQTHGIFTVLHADLLTAPPGNKDDFFMATNDKWSAFSMGWDFKRDIYENPSYLRCLSGREIEGCVRDHVQREMTKRDVAYNKVIVISGMPGSGKSMLLRRLGYDIATAGEGLVLVLNPARSEFDYRTIAGFIDTVTEKHRLSLDGDRRPAPMKTLILLDNASTNIRHVGRLRDFLTSRGRPALFVAVDRTADWEAALDVEPLEINDNDRWELGENLESGHERQRLIEHLADHDYILRGTLTDRLMENRIKELYGNSFFATIYSYIHPSRKPLNEIIKDQYLKLQGASKLAFTYVCCFYQFDLPINMELLVRALKCSYQEFIDDVFTRHAAKIIFEVPPDDNGNLLFRTHHRIIASKTIGYFFGDTDDLRDLFVDILSQCVLSNKGERELVEELLIQHIGPGSKQRTFTPAQQREIFKAVCKNYEVRTLVHHLGLVEEKDGNLPEAERLLKKALAIPREDSESYKGESDQNILTSLGSLYSRMSVDFLHDAQYELSQTFFDKAEQCFGDAKSGEFPNGHAYHSHGYLWYKRALQTESEAEKADCLARALEILATAIDNLNPDGLQLIHELETQVWERIGDEQQIARCLEVLRDEYGTGRGYYLSARFKLRGLDDLDPNERVASLRTAMRTLDKGLKYFPRDEHLLGLKGKITSELPPDEVDMEEYYKLLVDWRRVATTDNAWLLFELGVHAFLLGYDDISRDHFTELQRGPGVGHQLRTKNQYHILSETGRKMLFHGEVVDTSNPSRGLIRCDTPRNVKHTIPFLQFTTKATIGNHESVGFNIAFNYRGPIADNVRRS